MHGVSINPERSAQFEMMVEAGHGLYRETHQRPRLSQGARSWRRGPPKMLLYEANVVGSPSSTKPALFLPETFRSRR
jgi:hypothetical protein